MKLRRLLHREMVEATDTDFPKPVHNFGIFKKSGKRAILQFDFRNNKLHVIKHGVMKYSYDFEQLLQYDTEDGLNLMVKFVNKEIEFDAGSTEQKHTICRLLGMILFGGNLEPMSFQVPSLKEEDSEEQRRRKRTIIKEGILEKKGNTTIPIWAKRKVRVTPGEFSYFRPGEEVALNIIHLWKDDCKIKTYGNNGIVVRLTNRKYYFRVSGDGKGKEKETQRDEWLMAFEKACKLKRATVVMFGQEGGISQPLTNVNDDFMRNLQPIDNLSPTVIRAIQSRSFEDEFYNDAELYNRINISTDEELDDSENELIEDHGNDDNDYKVEDQNVSRDTEVTDEDVQKTDKEDCNTIRLSSVLPTKPLSALTSDRPKPPSTRRTNHNTRPEPEIDEVHEEKENSDITLTSNLTNRNIDSDRVFKFNDGSKEKYHPLDDSNTFHPKGEAKEEKKEISIMASESNASIKPVPSLAVPPGVPPPPVPPPPLQHKRSVLKSGHVSKTKLKQVHWAMVPKILIHNSLWHKVVDLTGRLNTEQLERLFSVNEVTTFPSSPAPKKDTQLLIDARRAQNISILMKGLHADGAKSLCSFLNSVQEDESFPAEKITTIRRYQPTQDEIEMYKMYTNCRQKLHPVDQFMLELCEIKCLSIRLDLVLILWDFPRQMTCVNQTVDNLLKACSELLKGESLAAVLYYILAIGNYMNSRYHKRDKGFQLSSCERFMGIRGQEAKYTLLHFLIDQLTASDPELLNWTNSVSSVVKCQDSSVKALSAELEVLKHDLNQMKKNLKTLKSELKSPTQEDMLFCKSVEKLLSERDNDLGQLTSKCDHVQQKYRHVLEKYGESTLLPSNQFFSSVCHFIQQFETAKRECITTVPI